MNIKLKIFWMVCVLFSVEAYGKPSDPRSKSSESRKVSKGSSFIQVFRAHGKMGLGLARRPFPSPEEPKGNVETTPTIGNAPSVVSAPTNEFEYTYFGAEVGLEFPWYFGTIPGSTGFNFWLSDPSSLLDLTRNGNKSGGQGGGELGVELSAHALWRWDDVFVRASGAGQYQRLLLLFRNISEATVSVGSEAKWIAKDFEFLNVIPVFRAAGSWKPFGRYFTDDPSRRPADQEEQDKIYSKKFSNSGLVQGYKIELEAGFRIPSQQDSKDILLGYQYMSKSYSKLISVTRTVDKVTETEFSDGTAANSFIYVSLVSQISD